ncbi:MAG: HAMP domain-containing histidine kinase [Nonomuraea sp.]|nr:HAMP domain-containing histidine kinase [Nonomuraea sp.]NUP61464.1 HAMP domain-containing histidine kinase [Nonomuraea sp.]NUP83433.1 HAMP domain-containing histidine kinase [Nonomuraea sp.]NUR86445.1 HAMP domain-containing histidine kinase [Nonomuraea sp.]NUS05687.1 HAMP domain-containing histidine kinase [Nonomuraea sp.]
MNARLVVTFTTLIVFLIAALAVPLGLAYASHRTNRLLLDRRADATRFAELADAAARDEDRTGLTAEVARYADLYGAAVRVRDRDGSILVTAGRFEADDREATRLALSGRTTEDLPTISPFGPSTVLLAEPAGRDAQLSGVVLLEAPTGQARLDVSLVWGALAAGALVALAYSAFAARRLARWILRPVTELDRTTRAIAQGQLDARAHPGVGPSELRRLEERFNTMADAVSAAMERQRAFVADASHELRTPLTVLGLRLENLEPHLREEGTAEYAEAMAELDRLALLVEDLLALAKVEAGAGLAAKEVALGERVAVWREVYAAKGVRLVTDISETSVVPEAAARIADIALDNAQKFVPEGGTVSVALDGEVLRIADDGPGLGEEERAEALGRFWRSGAHANVPGSGLGLAIATELAKACGGSLRLLPAVPHGLVVELTMPRP